MKRNIELNCLGSICIPLLLAFYLAMFFCIQPLHAAEAAEADTGWVEVTCSVPEDFEDAVAVMLLNEKTNERYAISCYKINDYIGRMEIPIGTYSVVQTYTSNEDFLYDAVTNTCSIEVGKGAAQRIELEVLRNGLLVDIASTESETAISETPVAPSYEPSENVVISEGLSESVSEGKSTDDVALAPGESTSEPEENDVANTDAENSFSSFMKQVVIIIFGTIGYVGAVFLIVYLYRRHVSGG